MTEEVQDQLTRILLEIPVGFRLNGRHFYLYQPTIGSGQLVGGLIKQLELNPEHLAKNASMELLRVIIDKPDLCCRIVALSSCKGKECLDNQKVDKIIKYLKRNAKPKDMVLFLQLALDVQTTAAIEKESGINAELEEMHRIQELKEEKGALTFCGKTIYGAIISTLAEKYGWTLDYIVWGISQNNINMLLADSVKTLYLSDDERKRIHPRKSAEGVIRADDPANKDLILSMNWD